MKGVEEPELENYREIQGIFEHGWQPLCYLP